MPWLEQTDLTSYMSAGRLAFDPTVEGRVWFAEGMGVWRADDVTADTVTWTSEAVGIEELVVSTIVDPPGDALFVGVADRQGFRLTSLDQFPKRGEVGVGPQCHERLRGGLEVEAPRLRSERVEDDLRQLADRFATQRDESVDVT